MDYHETDPGLEALEGIRQAIGLAGWPLNKSETMRAFALMGLTSRLQPLQINSSEQQQLVVDLATKLGDMAVAASEKK